MIRALTTIFLRWAAIHAAILGNEIERELKVALPMAMLIGQPTIRNVADALRLRRKAGRGRPVVLPIRTFGSQPPLFALPVRTPAASPPRARDRTSCGPAVHALQIPGA